MSKMLTYNGTKGVMFYNKYLPFMKSLTCVLRAQVNMTQIKIKIKKS